MVKASTMSMTANPGKVISHQADLMNSCPRARSMPQSGMSQRQTKTKERQTGPGENGVGHVDREDDGHRRNHVGEDVPAEDDFRLGAEAAGGFDVQLLLGLQRLASHDPVVGRDIQHRDRHNDVEDARPQYRSDGDGQDQPWKCVDAVHHEGHRPVGLPADEPGQQSERNSDDERGNGRREPDEDCDPRPPDQTAQDILAYLIGSEGKTGGVLFGTRDSSRARQRREISGHRVVCRRGDDGRDGFAGHHALEGLGDRLEPLNLEPDAALAPGGGELVGDSLGLVASGLTRGSIDGDRHRRPNIQLEIGNGRDGPIDRNHQDLLLGPLTGGEQARTDLFERVVLGEHLREGGEDQERQNHDCGDGDEPPVGAIPAAVPWNIRRAIPTFCSSSSQSATWPGSGGDSSSVAISTSLVGRGPSR